MNHFFYVSIICILAPFTAICHVDEADLAKLFEQHCAQLTYKEIPQAPHLITFSGTPGMGKSFVAQRLAEHYHAICLNADALRLVLHSIEQEPADISGEDLEQYLAYFIRHYTYPNKRIILDTSIDRKYTKVFSTAAKYRIPFVVIRLEVPRELVIKRLEQREGAKVAWYMSKLDGWFADYKAFGEQLQECIIYKNGDGDSWQDFVAALDRRLNC